MRLAIAIFEKLLEIRPAILTGFIKREGTEP